ncbi:MAG: Z1 domain-containing protein [Candidatus Doudnabacteria bacterium]|nr:Z1 domain-containing protein [Candidatus Doudnabacteria bacterium]
MPREIIHDGQNTTEALNVLSTEITSPESLHAIAERAANILGYAADPVAGTTEPIYGLLYGLIQSGKTSIITVTAAMSADNGFKCVVILTSDINPLYDQTLRRISSQLRGLPVLGKDDWNDQARFERQIRTSAFVVVCSKNSSHLTNLLEAFKKVGASGARGLPTLIIDDEADQASLNTYTQSNAKKRAQEISAINKRITELREFFKTNTYLQVTATPQALFLQRPDNLYRPSFTVLSEPGPGYVGGEAFFETDSKLLRPVPLEEVDEMRAGHQPAPTQKIPKGLRQAVLSFLVGAAAKNLQYPKDNFAFLCHISHVKVDHKRVAGVIDSFREEVLNSLGDQTSPAFAKLKNDLYLAYQDLAETEPALPDFEKIIERIKFLLPAANIKEINSTSDAAIIAERVYSIFVGGNKLGRGVTIPNLITSYYGRNPKHPNADTVLQHARMYGYRQKHIGVTRLFLPEKLAEHFRLIHQMEKALRELVAKYPEGKFEGIYITSPVNPTRKSVLDPNSIGLYVAGGYCNPLYPLRSEAVSESTKWLDEQLSKYDNENGNPEYYEITIDFVIAMIERCLPDPNVGAEMWDIKTLTTALEKLKTIHGNKAYIRVRRGPDGKGFSRNEPRQRETQGIETKGGELKETVPSDKLTLVMYRLEPSQKGVDVWWPMLRFPDGNYAIAFSFNR